MNVKAERIDQLIQIINRNLLLIFSGQTEGLTPLEFRRLHRLENAAIFGSDKFAFEMVHFVKTGRADADSTKESVAAKWERTFIRGLETLLFECAVVEDEIERDCFISRVYCWFTEKLVERRDLPRAGRGIETLKASIQAMPGNNAHSLKALENFAAQQLRDEDKAKDFAESLEKELDVRRNANKVDLGLPPIFKPDGTSRFGARQVPVYVKHNFPDVLNARPDYHDRLPKIPGADENYGLMYHKPETEAEQKMNELWIARRRQEAFEWKTQQHLSLVMDRLALHKSRLETDSLRRQESGGFMLPGGVPRPFSAGALSPEDRTSRTKARIKKLKLLRRRDDDFSPRSDDENMYDYSEDDARVGSAPGNVEEKEAQGRRSAAAAADKPGTAATDTGGGVDGSGGGGGTTSIRINRDGVEEETEVPQPSRKVYERPHGPKSTVPMRFRTNLPPNFSKKMERQEFYMQLSDSDDDDKPDKILKAKKVGDATHSKGQAKAGPKNAQPRPTFKRDKIIVRERPVSATLFREIAAHDPEFKVLYRHTNYRRMPLTAAQEVWLEEKETARVKHMEDYTKKLVEAQAAKAEKKGKKGDKGGAGKDKDKGGKDKKKKEAAKKKAAEAAAAAAAAAAKAKPKYRSAAEFMAIHFPRFDREDDETMEADGPMRTAQLIECERVLDTFREYNIPIKEKTVKNALMIPQDKPEAICLENMKNPGEGLMVNPNPPEYWRKVDIKVKKGKKKGGGKKKKK